MARAETHDQPAPRFTWRSLAGLFEEAWQREQRRRRWWLLAIVLLVPAGVFTAVLTGGGGNGSARPRTSQHSAHTLPDRPLPGRPLGPLPLCVVQPAVSVTAGSEALDQELPRACCLANGQRRATGLESPRDAHRPHLRGNRVGGHWLQAHCALPRRLTTGAAACLIMPNLWPDLTMPIPELSGRRRAAA